MIVIADSNIVFSAILNSQSKIGQLIINSSNIFRFYTVSLLKNAIKLVADIDENDTLFVALTNHLNAKLWTGDKKLISGLKIKGYSKILTTNDLYDIFLEKQIKSSQRLP